MTNHALNDDARERVSDSEADRNAPGILFFDAFVRVGPRRGKHPSHAWRLKSVLEEMAYCSISGALVASTQSVEYDPMHANRELSAALKPHPELFAIWNVMPSHTRECPEPEFLLDHLRDHQVPDVTIFIHDPMPRTPWDVTGRSSFKLWPRRVCRSWFRRMNFPPGMRWMSFWTGMGV